MDITGTFVEGVAFLMLSTKYNKHLTEKYQLTFKSNTSKTSKLSQQEIRRINFLGEDDCTCRVVIPRAFAKHLGIVKGTYMKISLDDETDKITVEKLGVELDRT